MFTVGEEKFSTFEAALAYAVCAAAFFNNISHYVCDDSKLKLVECIYYKTDWPFGSYGFSVNILCKEAYGYFDAVKNQGGDLTE